MTNEHTLPRWVSKLVPKPYILLHWGQNERNDPSVSWLSHDAAATTRTVCATCNNGWLSLIETKAEPLLKPMICGHSQELSKEQTEFIGLWVIKTAITYAQTTEHVSVIEQDVRDWIYNYKTSPPMAAAWMASYDPGLATHQFAKFMPRRLDVTDATAVLPTMHIYDWTIALGRLLFKVVILPKALQKLSVSIEFDEPKPLTPLWPYDARARRWPIGPSFTESELVMLSFALTGKQIEVRGLPLNEHAAQDLDH